MSETIDVVPEKPKRGLPPWTSLIGAVLVIIPVVANTIYKAESAYTRTSALEAKVHELEADRVRVSVLEVSLQKIKIQFCADEQLRNLMQVNNLRTEGMLMRKAYGTDYAASAYMPSAACE